MSLVARIAYSVAQRHPEGCPGYRCAQPQATGCRLAGQVLFGRGDGRIGERQCGHVSRLHLGCRHVAAFEFLVAGRAGVMNHRGGVTVVGAGPSGGVDAHVAHGAKQGDLLDTRVVEQGLQLGADERVDLVLLGLNLVRS